MEYIKPSFSNYATKGANPDGKCMTLSATCKNYPSKCEICFRVQGKYTKYKRKK